MLEVLVDSGEGAEHAVNVVACCGADDGPARSLVVGHQGFYILSGGWFPGEPRLPPVVLDERSFWDVSIRNARERGSANSLFLSILPPFPRTPAALVVC